MGMFDYIKYGDKKYQTKDTPAQFMENYEIRGDELWFEKVKREWIDDDEQFFGGYLEPVSSEWQFCSNFTGGICFYDYPKEEYHALFQNGKMVAIVEDHEHEN